MGAAGHAIEAEPLVNSQPVVVSEGIVFARRSEPAQAKYVTTQVDAGASDGGRPSSSSRRTAASSSSRAVDSTLAAPAQPIGVSAAFLYDSCESRERAGARRARRTPRS